LFHTPLLGSLSDQMRAALGKRVPHPARLGKPGEFAQPAESIVLNPMLNGETIACGVESMSRVPMGTAAMGKDTAGPLVAKRYPTGLVNQGVSAELIAAKWGFDRARLDEFSAQSHARAAAAAAAGSFDNEIVDVPDAGSAPHRVDETVRPGTTTDRLAALPPSFHTESLAAQFPQISWHITAGNSSPLTDGAPAALIMAGDTAKRLGLKPRARFHSFAVVGDDQLYMLTAPVPATTRVLDRAGLRIDDIDAYEINKAFAPVPLMWLAEFRADEAKLNPHGGAIALGHLLGASGTRLLATLVNYLEDTGGRYGLQTMCEGAGMANATIIERL
jgi:acetyl-CoA acyltransferase